MSSKDDQGAVVGPFPSLNLSLRLGVEISGFCAYLWHLEA
jgi:hypothetical protein